MFKLLKVNTTVLNSIVGLGLVLNVSIASATIILNFDSTSQSSNDPATGASAKTELSFSDVAGGGVKIDFNFWNTTGTSPFGAGATKSMLTGVAIDLFSPNTGVSDFVAGNYLDTLIESASADPFGTLDIAVADNDNFNGGNANGALAQGQTDSASLILSGTGLNAFDLENAFFTGFSDGSLNFVARFQQVNAGAGSDKLNGGTVSCIDCDPVPPTAIPEPAMLSLLSLGLLLLGASMPRKFDGYKLIKS